MQWALEHEPKGRLELPGEPRNWHRQIIACLTRENIRKDHKENIFTQSDLHRIRDYSR